MGPRDAVLLGLCLFVTSARSEVRVFVEDANGQAWLRYECTAGEAVRAFALDVSVDRGQIVGVSDFFVGESTAQAQGYGFFPASFRDHITVGSGTGINWNVEGYSPLAVLADNPQDTLPGLGSRGVTLEFGALWNPDEPSTKPGTTGTLCALRLSQGADVSVSPNVSRGGVVAANPDMILAPRFTGAFVQPPEIIELSMSGGEVTITFAGGELETAPTVAGPWSGTSDSSGSHTEPVEQTANKFYRVRSP